MAVNVCKTSVDLFEDQMDWLFHHGIGMQTYKTRGGRLNVVLCEMWQISENVQKYCRDNELIIIRWNGQKLVAMHWKRYESRFEIMDGLRQVLGHVAFSTWTLYCNMFWPPDVAVTSESYERLVLKNLLQRRNFDRKLAPRYLFHPQVYRHWKVLMQDEALKRSLPVVKPRADHESLAKCSLFFPPNELEAAPNF